MKSLNLEPASCEEILADIFGTTDSEQTQLGLVDAVNPSDFATKLSALEERWNRFEISVKMVVRLEVNSSEPELFRV